MAINSAAKRAAALGTSQPFLRLVIPDGTTDIAAALGMYNGITVNSTPTDIALSRSTVSVTGGLNATVGTLSATDADTGETFTYTLVAGAGDTDNASFNISGAALRCSDPSALGVSSRSIRVRVTDSASNTREEVFTINVIDATFSLLSSVSSVVTSTVTSRI